MSLLNQEPTGDSNTGHQQLINELLQVETATLGHLIDEGFMAPQLQCVIPGIRCCGPAVTVSLPGNDGYSLPLAIAVAKAGDILVIERLDDDQHACWGAVMTVAAQQAGIAGVVLDGYITDLSAIFAENFPVWCKGRSPLTTKKGKTGGTVNQIIHCGGVRVQAGDLILADENGVLSLPAEQMKQYLEQALYIQQQEPLIIGRLKQGQSLAEIYRS
ncbi:4-hydroxy-2-oxoglutarate aldolase [Serratia ficaria]|uniref:Putative 4-hydroxy-4-methyl-2-oxoglutarate aldolase n=1 Tax=Serratia ficaria TaxID=61651 RepID=A0A240AMP6_SERFI|nr:regulator of RNase E activity RraA [Serratia ficaria]CAI0941696.1 4-hydroxy-2-oxoglutarate aldolase [Serratia ficaria]CAI0957602.1 4-hydroxy-2-oxoglutarate aldolase [Serratia ficaria]CAI1039292.1 4-hydroxy-2-oxoglutarate aldolase [Serratia ficaria]CAI2063702.1 4-hydroxy-2-oxoglutarate aldolase [Serratia ficaria]